MYVVGLTGGIGSGKTAVSDYLATQSIEIVDADVISRQVVAPKEPALIQIKDHFGEHVINTDGSLNRSALREIIFQDAEHKQWLNQLLHPLIRQHILQALEQSKSLYTLLVAPLLFENNLDALTDTTILVDTTQVLQLSRTMSRDQVTQEQVEAIIASQMSREERCRRAQHILLNDQDLPALHKRTLVLHKKLVQAAQQKQGI